MICTILLPLVKSFPNIITDFDLSNIKTDTEISEYDFEAIENRITDYTEESVAQLIEHEFDVKVTVIVKIDFSDIEAIKLNEIRVYTDNTKFKEEMYLLLKNTYFCEVFIYEKK
jgi:chaperonin GroEL (HSP60 family)